MSEPKVLHQWERTTGTGLICLRLLEGPRIEWKWPDAPYWVQRGLDTYDGLPDELARLAAENERLRGERDDYAISIKEGDAMLDKYEAALRAHIEVLDHLVSEVQSGEWINEARALLASSRAALESEADRE